MIFKEKNDEQDKQIAIRKALILEDEPQWFSEKHQAKMGVYNK